MGRPPRTDLIGVSFSLSENLPLFQPPHLRSRQSYPFWREILAAAYACPLHSEFLAQLHDAPGQHLLQVGHLKNTRHRVIKHGSHLIPRITHHALWVNGQPGITRTQDIVVLEIAVQQHDLWSRGM